MHFLISAVRANDGLVRVFGLIPALLVSFSLLLWSICWSLADYIFAYAQISLQGTEASSSEAEASLDEEIKLKRALELVSISSKLNPLDPSVWLLYAELLDRAHHSDNMARDAIPARLEPSDFYVHTLRLRPHSVYFWQVYALYSLYSCKPAQETISRLDKALRFAPYRPYVRETELRIGFSLWDELNEVQRENLFSSIRDLEDSGLGFVIEAALAHDAVDDEQPILNAKEYQVVLGFALWEQLDQAGRKALQLSIQEVIKDNPRFVAEAAIASARSENLRAVLKPSHDMQSINRAHPKN